MGKVIKDLSRDRTSRVLAVPDKKLKLPWVWLPRKRRAYILNTSLYVISQDLSESVARKPLRIEKLSVLPPSASYFRLETGNRTRVFPCVRIAFAGTCRRHKAA